MDGMAPCGCPKHPRLHWQSPPTEAKQEKLEQFLVDYYMYKSSTFNTCPHQTLLLMEGPNMRLMVDPNAQPVAHHKAIPVPLHWFDKVKAGQTWSLSLRLFVIRSHGVI